MLGKKQLYLRQECFLMVRLKTEKNL